MKPPGYILLMGAALLGWMGLRCSHDPYAGGSEIGNPGPAALTGRVVETGGQAALEGIQVRLRKSNYLKPTGTEGGILGAGARDTLTDEEGSFVLANIDTGLYHLEITDGVSQGLRLEVTVSESEDTLNLGSHTLKQTAVIQGTVEDSGAAAGTIYVQIYGMERLALVDPVTHDYIFENVPEGDYTLKVVSEAPSLGPTEIPVSTASGDTVKVESILLSTHYSAWEFQEQFFLNTTPTGVYTGTDLLNFPLRVKLDAGRIDFNSARPEEIRFAGPLGQPLAFEIDHWDAAAGVAEVWVNIDTLKANSEDQFFTLYWGNAAAENASSPEKVFSSQNGFSAVWHFGSGDNLADASSQGNHGTLQGGLSRESFTSGILGTGLHLDGQGNYINFSRVSGIPTGNQPYTISTWIYPLAMGTYSMVGWGEYDYMQSTAFRLSPNWSGGLHVYWYSHDLSVETGDLSQRWSHVVTLYDGSERQIYLNGQLMGSDFPEDHRVPYTDNLTVGTACCDEYFPGILDEMRISHVSRSPDWIRLCYENQRPDPRLIAESSQGWEYESYTVLQLPDSLWPLAQDVGKFPLPLRLNSTNFNFTQADARGRDLRFITRNGLALPYEIESWDSENEEALVWVLIDSLINMQDSAYLMIRWGNPYVTDRSASHQVFSKDDGYAAVWHFAESAADSGTPNLYRNAVENANHGWDYVTSENKDGILGPGQHFTFGDYIRFPNPTDALRPQNRFVYSTWVKLDSLDSEGGLLFTLGDNYGIRFTNTGITLWTYLQKGNEIIPIDHEFDFTDFDFSSWHHVVFSYSPGQVEFYWDGVLAQAWETESTLNYFWNNFGLMGKHIPGGPPSQLMGSLDESRLENLLRSPEWIRLTYETQKLEAKGLVLVP